MTKQEQINALEKAIKSSTTPDNLKEKMRDRLAILKGKEETYSEEYKPKKGDTISFVESSNFDAPRLIGIVDYKNQLGFITIVNNKQYELKKLIDIKLETQKTRKIKSTSATPVKKAAKKYYSNREIKSITVMENGKKVTYSGKDVFNGANFLEKGGKLSERAKYITKANIVSVEFTDGTEDKPSNGYHIKKGATPIMEKGGEIPKVSKIDFYEIDYNKLIGDISKDYPFYSVKNGINQEVFDEKTETKVGVWNSKTNTLRILKNNKELIEWLINNSYVNSSHYEHGGPVYLPEGSLIHYQNYYLEKGGKVNSSEVIKLIPLELESLSSQLKKYTGEQYNSDFVDEKGKDNLPKPGEILVHKISGMKFLMPEKIYNHIDGYNLVIDKSNSEIVVFENGKTIAEIVDGKLDFTFKDSDISINKPKVLAAFDKNKIPFLVIKPEYEVFDLSGFLNYVYPKAKELLKEYNLKLDKDFTISKGKQSFLAEPMYSSIDGKAGKVVIAYYDDEMEMVGTIDFNLSDNELHFQFEDWKIDEVDMYKLGGSLKSAWKRERKYVNKSQDYETRYAKGKNRSGYKDKFEKGGFIDWKSKPDKKVKGIYEISSPNFKGNIEIVGFEREDDVFYSLYQPLSGERIGPKEIHTFKVNSNKINNLDKGNVVIALDQLGNKIKVKRVANLGTQNYLQKGGKINKNSKVGKYAKVDIGGYGNIFHYGKIMSFEENGAFEDHNGYKVSGIGDLLKEGQFSVITEKEYLDKRKNIPSNDSELKKDSFVLIIKDLKPKQKKEGNPIFKKASEIREPGEKWLDAVKRAKSLV